MCMSCKTILLHAGSGVNTALVVIKMFLCNEFLTKNIHAICQMNKDISCHRELGGKLVEWFSLHGRDLPWRKAYDPYHVWISEIMLQQTQMERGVAYFNRWIERFTTPRDVADASEEDILNHWEGLGYYSRAMNIRKAARIICREHGGIIPDTPEVLRSLPGIGPYTAAAIASIAYRHPVPVVDANVERVLARLFDIDEPPKQARTARRIHDLAGGLMPASHAREFNQAMMELGALVCLPKKPRCSACPVVPYCQAYHLDIVLERPVPRKAAGYIPIEVATGVLVHDGRIFIQKRPASGVWANLWEFPGGSVESGETPAQALLREYYEETEFRLADIQPITVIRHGYTKYRVSLHCFYCSLDGGESTPILHAAQEFRWVRPEQLDDFAFPAGHRKLIAKIRETQDFLQRVSL